MVKRVSAVEEFGSDELAMVPNSQSSEADSPSHFQGLSGHHIRDEASKVLADLKALDLMEHVAELEVMGLTVIPPEKVGLLGQLNAAREALLDVCERRYSVRPDWVGNSTHATSETPFGKLVSFIGLEDPIFADIMLNPTILAMATQQVGRNCVLSAFQAALKAKGGIPLDLHVDELIAPAPYAIHNDSINCTIPLTDYTEENGALAYVPGSHKYMRAPLGREGWDQRVKVLARKGSAIIWPRSTWHGAFVGTAPGLRLSLILVYARPHMRTLEDYRSEVRAEHFKDRGPRFAKLMGRHLSYGWKHEGPVLDGSETLIGSTAFN